MHSKGEYALALARAGFRVFPLQEDDPAKTPEDIKKPALAGDWKAHATTDPAAIAKWWGKRNYNIGVATLPDSDLIVLDYDCKAGQNGAAALRTHDMLDLPQSFRVETASGGTHVYLRAPKGAKIPNSVSKVAKHVDVRGNERGGYVVGPGSTIHGKAYATVLPCADDAIDAHMVAEAPEWMLRLATANRKSTKTKQGEILGDVDTKEAIDRATNYLKDEAPEAVEGAGGNNETFRVACHIRDFGISEATAYDLLAEHWNDQKAAPPWPADELERIVHNAYAYASLPVGVSNAKAEFEAAGQLMDTDSRTAPQPKPKQTLYLVDFEDGAAQALDLMAEPLIDEVLNAGDLSALYGPSNSGKTFVALDMAYHVGTGRKWHGERVTKYGLAIYVATEGSRGIFKRIAALKQRFNDKQVLLAVVPCPINLLDSSKEADTKKLIDLIHQAEQKYGQKAALITVDTLSRALAGGDENASTDMGVLIRHVDKLRAATMAHVMLVHHTGKDTARGARGWSGIRAAIDTEIELLENRITVTKQRDIEAIEPIGFKLAAVDIGVRRGDGKRIKSCVVEYRDAPEFDVQLSRAEERFFNALKDLADKNATNTLTTEQIVKAFECQKITSDIALRRTGIANYLSALSEKGIIENPVQGQYVVGDVNNVKS